VQVFRKKIFKKLYFYEFSTNFRPILPRKIFFDSHQSAEKNKKR